MFVLKSGLHLRGLLANTIYRSLHIEKTAEFRVYRVVQSSFREKICNYLGQRLSFAANIFGTTFQKNMLNVQERPSAGLLEKYVPGDQARGIKKLDRKLFTCLVKALGISVPNNNLAQFRKLFKASILRITNVKPVVNLDESDDLFSTHKLVLLDSNAYKSSDEFISKFSDQLAELSVESNTCKHYDLKLEYENWNYDEILNCILPKEGTDGIGGFSIVGHIAHLNVREELLEYKHIIGEVLLDKISCLKTVVNKLHTIDNTFRNFQMEVLAGEENFVTLTREHGFTYEFDFSKIYWNPRLSNEHQRIVSLVSSKDVLFDVFAGVGPFSIPASKKGCKVYANDLNPDSVHWLEKNLKTNKIPKDRVEVFNLDGRNFLKDVVGKELRRRMQAISGEPQQTDHLFHISMNLPALAIEFLDSFVGLMADDKTRDLTDTCLPLAADITAATFSSDIEPITALSVQSDSDVVSRTPVQDLNAEQFSNVIVHCYGFSKESDPESDVMERVKDVLRLDSLNFYDVGVKRVRNVAPNKEMLCVSFRLPWELLLRSEGCPGKRKQDDKEEDGLESKRIKMSDCSS